MGFLPYKKPAYIGPISIYKVLPKVPKIKVRRGVMFSKGCRRLIGLISFVVDPGVLKRVLKHGVQAILESELDLTRSQHIIDPPFSLSVMTGESCTSSGKGTPS
jgi:hypothetical protein